MSTTPAQTQTPPINRFGWVRDLPDHRDLVYTLAAPGAPLPTLVDLRPQCPPVYNQGSLGSCTANAIGFLYQFERVQVGLDSFVPSRLFIYYNERVLMNTVKIDSGAYIRDGIKTMVKQGSCPEPRWPYTLTKFKTKPTATCYKLAAKYKAVEYRAVRQDINDIRGVLASGSCIAFGFSVYSSFMTDEVARTGNMPMPSPSEGLLGGHAVALVGYDDSRRVFIVRNSWGDGWGDKGYFYMPYDYVTNPNLAADLWSITKIS